MLYLETMTNNKEAACIFTTNEQMSRLAEQQGIPSTSSSRSTFLSCEEERWKRKRNSSSNDAQRMKIFKASKSPKQGEEQDSQPENSRIDPCHLPPELFRRILSFLRFTSLRHAMLVSIKWKNVLSCH